MPATGRQRFSLALSLIALAALAIWYANQVAPHIRDLTQGWQQYYLFDLMVPVGADFRAGVYFPGSLLARGLDPYVGSGLWYPPFSALLLLPYQLLDWGLGYSIHIPLLVLLAIASVWCAISITGYGLGKLTPSRGPSDPGVTLSLFLSLAFLTVNSYGFTFGLERGNIDTYALAFCLAGLWLLVRRPNSVWLPVLCFSAAAHLKVYPAVLFILLLWKHGPRSLLPLLVVNVALLFCLGPNPALHFLGTLSGVMESPGYWVGNHSAASFGLMANGFLGARGLPAVPSAVFLAVPVVIWGASVLVLLRKGYSESGAVWLFAVSVPLMNLIPSTSHDYKLVLLSAPFAILLTILVMDYTSSGRGSHLAQIAVACVLLVFLSVSYVQLPSVLANKYPFILGTQGLLLWALLMPSDRLESDLPGAHQSPGRAPTTA